jgi:serine protease
MRMKMILPLLAMAFLGCSEPKSNFLPTEVDPTSVVGDVVPGQMELDLADNLTAADIEQLGKDYGIVIRDNSPESHHLGNIAVAMVDPQMENQVLSRMAHDPRVEVAEPLLMAHALYTPNDPQYKDQWHMERVGAPTAWKYSCGQGVTVAVVDTGITAEETNGFKVLSDLKEATFVPGYNFVSPGQPPHDDQGHGSHCAGTVAQVTNNGIGVAGLSHCVRLMPVKVLSASGSGTMAGVAEGIVWAADHGANVISLSLGSSADSAVVAKAVKYAHGKGVFLSCAAGNSGGSVGYPAANKGCVAVSASDQSDNLATFSSRGKEVAIAAPGVAVTQQTISEGGKGQGQFSPFNGTSMATPHVSAAAALVMSQGVTDPDKVLEILQGSAVEKQDASKFGAGILNAESATSSVFMKHTIYRVGFLAFFAFVLLTLLKKNNKTLLTGRSQIVAGVAAVVASVGALFFLPFVGVLNYMGSFRWLGELLSRPLGEWDLVWHTSLHGWLPLANVLPAFSLVAVGFHRPAFRALAGGLAIGTAAYLMQTAWLGESQFVFGTLIMRVWAMLNVVACLWVAKNTLGK